MTENDKKAEKLDQNHDKKLSKGELDSIRKGIRPNGMDFEEFKVMRSFLKKVEKDYLRGQPMFVSQNIENKKLGKKGLTYKK